jgi:pilus assembly protein CpaB
MNRRILAVIVAVLLAVGGAALVINYVRNADARAIAENQPTKVYVAEKLIPAGTTLKDAQRTELVVETRVAASALPKGALQEIGPDNNALLALSDVQPGEYLLSARFGSTPVGEKAIEVPAGMLAMSVELSDPARVGKFVTPGSHIAVYATHGIKAMTGDDKAKAFNELDVKGTTVLLPDVQVIAMGNTALAAPKKADADSDKAQSSAPSFLVTVAVTPEDAPRLAHGIAEYTLYAGLRGPDVKVDDKSNTNDITVFKYDINDLLKLVQP